MRCVIKAKALMHDNMNFKETKNNKINIKAREGFNMILPVIPISTDGKKYFYYS